MTVDCPRTPADGIVAELTAATTFKSAPAEHRRMERANLEDELQSVFGGDEQVRRAISRQARDLTDSDRIREDFGYEPTVDTIVDHLADAPDDHTLAERWNWWVGSLDLSKGGYQRFHVRPDIV